MQGPWWGPGAAARGWGDLLRPGACSPDPPSSPTLSTRSPHPSSLPPSPGLCALPACPLTVRCPHPADRIGQKLLSGEGQGFRGRGAAQRGLWAQLLAAVASGGGGYRKEKGGPEGAPGECGCEVSLGHRKPALGTGVGWPQGPAPGWDSVCSQRGKQVRGAQVGTVTTCSRPWLHVIAEVPARLCPSAGTCTHSSQSGLALPAGRFGMRGGGEQMR